MHCSTFGAGKRIHLVDFLDQTCPILSVNSLDDPSGSRMEGISVENAERMGGLLRKIEDDEYSGKGQIYFNLGNAYLRLGDLGKSILFYERARLFIPKDADLNLILSYAQDRTLDVIDESGNFISQGFFRLDEVNLYEIFLGLNPIFQALIAILFTWLMTAPGICLKNGMLPCSACID
jgi:hypothetical protein